MENLHFQAGLSAFFPCALQTKYVLHCCRGVFSKLPCKMNTGEKSTFGHLVLTFRRLESPSRNTVVSRRQLSIHGDVSIGREHFRGIHTPRFQKPRGDWSFHVSRGLLTAQGVALTERLPGGERSTSN